RRRVGGEGCRAGPAQGGGGRVVQALVAGVGVDRRHQARLDSEGIVEHLCQGRQRVGGARAAGEDVVAGRVEVVVVCPQDERGGVARGGGGDGVLWRAALEGGRGGGAVREVAGGLDDDVGAGLTPGDGGRVGLREDRHPRAPHGDRVAVDGDAVEVAGDR